MSHRRKTPQRKSLRRRKLSAQRAIKQTCNSCTHNRRNSFHSRRYKRTPGKWHLSWCWQMQKSEHRRKTRVCWSKRWSFRGSKLPTDIYTSSPVWKMTFSVSPSFLRKCPESFLCRCLSQGKDRNAIPGQNEQTTVVPWCFFVFVKFSRLSYRWCGNCLVCSMFSER